MDKNLRFSIGMDESEENVARVVKFMESLLRVISDQLQHGGWRLTAAVDRTQLSWKFIEQELRSLVRSLRELLMVLRNLGPAFLYVDRRMEEWWGDAMYRVANLIHDQFDGTDRPRIGGCQPRLHRTAACCFHPDAGRSLFYKEDMMQKITLRLYEAAESPCRYNHLLHAGDVESRSRAFFNSAQTHAHAGAGASLVGIEGALRSKQLRWFMAAGREAHNKTLKVMAMVGPAGVGKTTLAMEVHRQLQLTEGFQLCATAKVSQSPDIKELLKHILSQVEDKHAANRPGASNQTSQVTRSLEAGHDCEMLAGKINKCLQGKRYLVIIHDVWKEKDWDIIKNAFPENLGSRIIITTQLRRVAQFCCPHSAGLVHEVNPLGAVDAKRLLFKKVFGSEDVCPTENLKLVCDEILRRCEGIPLFIIGMAGWLHEQLEKAQDTNYNMEMVPKLLNQFKHALATICDDLPYDLKVMLMHMSAFTEGYTFDKDTLIEKWIDHGMINGSYNHEILDELIDRSVVTRVAASSGHNLQVEEAYHWHVGYFRLQYLASKSAQFLASESADDHGFVCTLDSTGAHGGQTVIRRLSLHEPHPELLTLLRRMELSHTRLLSVSGEVSQIPLHEFSHLVVLDLEGWQCFKDGDMLLICKMFLLRHLSLRKVTGVSKLPPAIKELQFLLSLDISQTSICELPSQVYELEWLEKLDLRRTKVRQLPQQFRKLWRLKCLLVGGDGVAGDETITTEISELDVRSLRSLEILTVVDLTRCSPSLVEALSFSYDLLEIAITWSFHQCTDGRFQEALRSCIRKWNHLKSLTIHCGLGCRMDFLDLRPSNIEGGGLQKLKMVDGRFASVPEWLRAHPYLTFVEISVCALLRDDLGILGTLRCLECLVLGLDFIPEAELVIGTEQHPGRYNVYSAYVSFCGLRRLSVSCRVPWLTFTQGAMPALTLLELKIAGYPASQESIPSGISNLGRLSDVSIRFHKNYNNRPNVKMTVEAVKKEIAGHRMPINLFINDIEDQAEDFQAAEEGLATARYRQSEIQNEESSSIGEQEQDVQEVEAGPASEIEEVE